MKNFVTAIALVFAFVNASQLKAECTISDANTFQIPAQDTVKDFKKGIDGMLEMAGKGKNVFVECADSVVLDYAHQALNEWKYWKIVNKKEEADFILQVEFDQKTDVKWQLFAVFISPIGKEIYKSSPAEKFGLGKLKARESTTNYLITNIVRPFFELE